MKQEMADDLHFSPAPLSQKQYLSSTFASKKKRKEKESHIKICCNHHHDS